MITIEDLVKDAGGQGASDLHIMAGQPPRARIDGTLSLLTYQELSLEDVEGMLKPILKNQYRAILDKQGEVDFSFRVGEDYCCRVNVYLMGKQPSLSMRILGGKIPEAEELGLPDSVVGLVEKRQGLILLAGALGSGKTTTAASLIDRVNICRSTHIITLESPVEYVYQQKKSIVSQREIGTDSISYAKALRAALHEDPDIIYAAELRDPDSALTALAAAQTGCLVIAALPVSGVVYALDYIVGLFLPQQQQAVRMQLASVIEAVVSQQLIPKKDGGRIAAFEVMHATEAVRDLIRQARNSQVDSVMEAEKKLGMQTMDDAVYHLYLSRKIEAEQAILFAKNPADMARRIS